MPESAPPDAQTIQELEKMVAERTRYLELTRDIALIANRATSVTETLGEALDLICDHNEWSFCHAYLLEDRSDPSRGLVFQPVAQKNLSAECSDHLAELARSRSQETLVQQAFETGLVQWADDLTRTSLADLSDDEVNELEIGSTYVFPITLGEQVVGVLEFFSREGGEPSDSILQTMASVGGLIARVMERKRMERQVALAVWEEQRRAGHHLHDSLGQELTGLALLARSLQRQLSDAGRPEAGIAAELVDAADQVQRRVRALSRGLYASELHEGPEGLMTALAHLCEQTGKRFAAVCEFVSPEAVLLEDQEVATQLFYIASEAMTNALRHAAPTRVRIRLERLGENVVLSIEDDGSGFVETSGEGLGLGILRYRAGVIGGELTLKSNPGQGTLVRCTVPLPSAPDDDSCNENQPHQAHDAE